MPRLPRSTITSHIPNQLSDIVRTEYPRFIQFLQSYYDWLETAGAVVMRCKILGTGPQSITFPVTASPNDHAYNGLFVVVENGTAKGYTRRITSYDGASRTATLETAWEDGRFPASNSRVVLRDALHPQRLEDYGDIDHTLDEFVEEFSQQFLSQLPGATLADKRRLIKRIKDFNRARGTEKSFQLLFRILYDSEAEFYYPKVDLFRTSDNYWYVERTLRIPASEENKKKLFSWKERRIIGTNGASAKVELAILMRVGFIEYFELFLSNVDGEFTSSMPLVDLTWDTLSIPWDANTQTWDESSVAGNIYADPVKIVYPFEPEESDEKQGKFYSPGGSLEEPRSITEYDQPYRILTGIEILNGGDDYAVGDLIDIVGCSILPGKGIITSVGTKLYKGRCGPSPEGGYFEPYWGPDVAHDPDHNTFPNPLQIGQWGKHFWSDVNIVLNEDQIVSDNEIQLASNESEVDDFFKGFSITLVDGTGKGQTRTILSYDGINKVALVDVPWSPVPDTSTEYAIFKTRGPAKQAKVTDPGLGFYCDPDVDFSPSATGTGATGRAILGVVNEAPGKFLNRKSFTNSDKIIQDSYYWQDFSYDIKSGEMLTRYKDIAKALLHPAGMMMFGSVAIKSKVNKKPFYQVVQEWILELGTRFFDDNTLEFSRHMLIKWTTHAGVIGNTYGRFDSERKFRLYHPNVDFNLQYPPPNDQYYRGVAQANTQIAHFIDRPISDFINFPNRRLTLAGDSFIRVDNTESTSRAGVVGVSMRALERAKFFGMPPFDGFNQTYPSPNEAYWAANFANTQIGGFQNVVIQRAAVTPQRMRNNVVGDSFITISTINSGVPSLGNVIEYNFVEGANDQLIYNVSPNSIGLLNAIRGANAAPDTDDPDFVLEGTFFTDPSQLINAEAVPHQRQMFTMIMVFRSANLSQATTIMSNIPDASADGFSLDILSTGALSLRAQESGSTHTIKTAASVITQNNWFMATVRVVGKRAMVNVNNTVRVEGEFVGYPSIPVDSTEPWLFGSPAVNYPTIVTPTGLFGATLPGKSLFRQPTATVAGTTLNPHEGFLAYYIYYNRSLEEDEVLAAYQGLKTRLTTRNITLP